jgi:hypothetical protein
VPEFRGPGPRIPPVRIQPEATRGPVVGEEAMPFAFFGACLGACEEEKLLAGAMTLPVLQHLHAGVG